MLELLIGGIISFSFGLWGMISSIKRIIKGSNSLNDSQNVIIGGVLLILGLLILSSYVYFLIYKT
jgi:hypothetical protein